MAPVEWLLRYVVPDDAFYYFTIARNIGNGHGVTFDRLAETNGYHPLWQFLLVPIFGSVADPYLAMHLSLTLCALLEIVSILMIYRIAGRGGMSDTTRSIIVLLFAFSPVILSRAGGMNGLETALNTLVLLLFFDRYLVARSWGERSMREILLFGIATGLHFLARTDNAIIIAVFYLSLLIQKKWSAESLRRFTLSGIIALLVALPWLLWNLLTFGSIVQVSGKSIGFFARTYFDAQGWGWGEYAWQAVRNSVVLIRFVPLAFVVTRDSLVGSVVLAAGCLAGAVLAIKRKWFPEIRAAWSLHHPILITMIVAFLLYITVHTFRAVLPRTWYYASFVPFGLIGFGYLLNPVVAVLRKEPRNNSLVVVAGIAFILVAHAIGYNNALVQRSRDPDMYRMAEWAAMSIPAGTRIGAWNAGIYGYFMPRQQVINLDCVVNNDAYPYFRQRRMAAYCDSTRITHLIDDRSTLRGLVGFWGGRDSTIANSLEILHEVSIRFGEDTVVAGRRRGD